MANMQRMMKIIENKKLKDLLYLIGIAIFAFSRIWQYSLIFDLTSKINTVLRIFTFVLLLPKLLLQKYSKNELYVCLSLVIYTILCIVLGGDNNLIIIPCILLGLKDIDIKKIIKIIFIINISVITIHFVCFVINYYLNNQELLSIFHFMWTDGNNNLMFRNRNMFAIRYMCAIMQYIYITNRDDKRFIKTIVLLLISIFVFQISNSRVCFLMCIILIMFMLLENNKLLIKYSELIKSLSFIISVIFTLIMIIVGNNMDNSLCIKIDNLLAWRPHYLSEMCNYVGINVLPNIEKFNSIKEHFGNFVVIVPDNSYIALLLKWGVVLAILLLLIVYYFVFRNKNDLITNYFISAIFLFFTMEYFSNEYIIYIVPLLVMSNYFNNKNI